MAVNMFLKLDGVKGEATDSKHLDEIEILAWSWGMSSQTGPGYGADESAKVNMQDISLTKWVDTASNLLISSCCQGALHKSATLVIRKEGEGQPEYIVIKIKNVKVSSVSMGGSRGENRLTENVCLYFERFEYAYQPQNPDGSANGSKRKFKFGG